MTALSKITINGVLGLVAIVVLLVAPALTDDFLLINALTTAGLFAMFAASWDILSGYTGQENFGHAAFIGAGGFTVGLFARYADLPVEPMIVLAAVAAGALGLVVGIPSLRLRGPYLALATLVAAAALLRLAIVFKTQTGGEEGISGIPRVAEGVILGPVGRGLARLFVSGFDQMRRLDQTSFVDYYVVLAVGVALVATLGALGRSRVGLILRSIQQDDLAAEAAGVSTTRYKLIAFVVSAAAAGLAGGLRANTLTQVNIDSLSVNLSLLVIVMAVLGGVGSIVGPVAGAYVVVLLDSYAFERLGIFTGGSQGRLMLFSGALIVILLVQPRGLVAPALRRLGGRRLIPERRDA